MEVCTNTSTLPSLNAWRTAKEKKEEMPNNRRDTSRCLISVYITFILPFVSASHPESFTLQYQHQQPLSIFNSSSSSSLSSLLILSFFQFRSLHTKKKLNELTTLCPLFTNEIFDCHGNMGYIRLLASNNVSC